MRVALVGDYIFEEAATVEESIECAGSFRPDVALVDVMMPGGSGLEIIRYLKADTELRHARCVVDLGVLGRGRPQEAARGRRRGLRPQAVRPRRALAARWRSCSSGDRREALLRRGSAVGSLRGTSASADNAATAPIVARVVGAIGVLALLVAAAFAFVLRRDLEPARLHERAGRREPRDDRCAAPRARGRRARPEPSRLRAHAQRRDPRELGASRAVSCPERSRRSRAGSRRSRWSRRSSVRSPSNIHTYVTDYGKPMITIADEDPDRRALRDVDERGPAQNRPDPPGPVVACSPTRTS